MVLRTGKPGVCLDNNSAGNTPPDPSLLDRRDPVPVRPSLRCVFLTCDLKDCMVFVERCAWCVSQGLCIRPGSNPIRYRGAPP